MADLMFFLLIYLWLALFGLGRVHRYHTSILLKSQCHTFIELTFQFFSIFFLKIEKGSKKGIKKFTLNNLLPKVQTINQGSEPFFLFSA